MVTPETTRGAATVAGMNIQRPEVRWEGKGCYTSGARGVQGEEGIGVCQCDIHERKWHVSVVAGAGGTVGVSAVYKCVDTG